MNFLAEIREKKPLVYNITNQVVTNFSANGLLAIGASPAMANAPEEAKEMAQHADALVLNVGTCSTSQAEAMLLAGEEANKRDIPVILDPVAVGATTFRAEVVEKLLNRVSFTAIRGNAAEIATVGKVDTQMKGVDSLVDHLDDDIALKVAQTYETTIIATGKIDVITDGDRVFTCENGTPMLPFITGSGCLLSAVIGAFMTIGDDALMSAMKAVAGYGIAAELAMEKAAGPGSFLPAFLDELYYLKDETIAQKERLKNRSGEGQ